MPSSTAQMASTEQDHQNCSVSNWRSIECAEMLVNASIHMPLRTSILTEEEYEPGTCRAQGSLRGRGVRRFV